MKALAKPVSEYIEDRKISRKYLITLVVSEIEAAINEVEETLKCASDVDFVISLVEIKRLNDGYCAEVNRFLEKYR